MPKDHKHKWIIVIDGGGDPQENIYVYAVCECGAKLDEEEIQKRLNILERMAD